MCYLNKKKLAIDSITHHDFSNRKNGLNITHGKKYAMYLCYMDGENQPLIVEYFVTP